MPITSVKRDYDFSDLGHGVTSIEKLYAQKKVSLECVPNFYSKGRTFTAYFADVQDIAGNWHSYQIHEKGYHSLVEQSRKRALEKMRGILRRDVEPYFPAGSEIRSHEITRLQFTNIEECMLDRKQYKNLHFDTFGYIIHRNLLFFAHIWYTSSGYRLKVIPLHYSADRNPGERL